ncbi:MAG: TetR/AcrR family transcriptional regulator [Gammaproteobacteria bacterium]|nr:TetR/AcrR family transcriptional regulator [Gammaproteobacteria bacterium]
MNVGRPRQFDEDKSLNAAMLQFWRHGYASTSMQDLLSATGLSKSSLYQSFGNKSKLFSGCLEHYQQRLIVDLDQQLSSTSSGLQFIENLLNTVISEATAPQRKGCLLVNTASELAGLDSEIAQAVERGFTKIRSVIARAITKAQQNHEVSAEVDVELMADFLVSGISGLRTMVKSGASHNRLERVSEMLLNSLK